MKEKRGEEENPLVEEEKEQEHKRIEGDIKKLGEQKWYLKSKIIYVLCFITPPIGYLYVFLFRKNDRRCKANVLNGCDDYDGIMVFEVSSALCVGNYRCCRSMSFVYSEVYNENTKPMWTWCFIYKLKLTLLFITTNNKDIAFRIANNMFRDATN